MLHYAELGTLVILIICSIFMLGVIIERFISWGKIKALGIAFRRGLKPLLEAGDEKAIQSACGGSKAPLAAVLMSTFEVQTELRPEQTQLLLRHALDGASAKLRSFLSVLATLAGTAPFIGLFGTVLGIMHTFQSIAEKGFGNPAHLSAGISQALIATAAGLAVAIPSVIFYNVFTKKANQTIREVDAEATQILIMLGRI